MRQEDLKENREGKIPLIKEVCPPPVQKPSKWQSKKLAAGKEHEL